MIHFGCIANIPAIAILCFCPPDNKCGACLLYSLIPTFSRASSTLFLISCGGTPKFSGPKATSSSTIVATNWLSGFWNTIPALDLISHTLFSSVVSNPFTITVPSVGINKAFICFATVDFPDPLCPKTTKNSPLFTSKFNPSIANFSIPSSPVEYL